MGGLVDVDTLVKEVKHVLASTGRNTFKRTEIPGLIRKAAESVFEDHRKREFPIRPTVSTNASAGETPRRGVRMPSGDRVMDRVRGVGSGT